MCDKRLLHFINIDILQRLKTLDLINCIISWSIYKRNYNAYAYLLTWLFLTCIRHVSFSSPTCPQCLPARKCFRLGQESFRFDWSRVLRSVYGTVSNHQWSSCGLQICYCGMACSQLKWPADLCYCGMACSQLKWTLGVGELQPFFMCVTQYSFEAAIIEARTNQFLKVMVCTSLMEPSGESWLLDLSGKWSMSSFSASSLHFPLSRAPNLSQ